MALDGPPPDEDQLNRLARVNQSEPRQVHMPKKNMLGPWTDQIYQWLTGDRLQMTSIQELLAARGCSVSCPSLRRFVVKGHWRKTSRTPVRMEDTPAGVSDADFGRLGMITDPETGRRRTVRAMLIVLRHSKHCFLWSMHLQKLEDVIS